MVPADFLGGVVEGFYGKPWAHHQRLHLFGQMAGLGLNTYFYAPKHDLNHRSLWREHYSDGELTNFRELVQACNADGLNFVYGLSPGLDVRFAEEAERNRIKVRFDQLRKVGVRHFALLFDDLPGNMSDVDNAAYASLAAAQCDLTNDVFGWARMHDGDVRFLFCPTPYCDRMDREQLGGPGYLDDIGRLLNAEIDVLWTGPEIVPSEIPVDSIQRLTRRIRRPPVIWDNLFANDYDARRLYCGPYSDRPLEIQNVATGILINPNNEYPINYIPLRTFAAFINSDGEWSPREAFLKAAADWLPCFKTVSNPLPLEDLILLADCFYLPHAEGPEAQKLLGLVHRLLTEPVEIWGDAHQHFSAINVRIQRLFDRLGELRDRELFDAWSRHIWQLKEEFQLIEAVLRQKMAGRDIVEGVELGQYLLGTFRGGTLAKLEGLLSMDADGKIRVGPPTSSQKGI